MSASKLLSSYLVVGTQDLGTEERHQRSGRDFSTDIGQLRQMQSLPQPPAMQQRRLQGGVAGVPHHQAKSPAPSPRRTQVVRGGSSGGLPPPPNISQPKGSTHSNYAQNLARTMTIEEMRDIHRRAVSDAEAKQTELRLVLASRYRELVGSSDEVTKMRERSQELHELVHALPSLMEKLIESTSKELQEAKSQESELPAPTTNDAVLTVRRELSALPRLIYRSLDKNDVHQATQALTTLFRLISEQTDEYVLANTLAREATRSQPILKGDALLHAQMKMTFLHLQTLPAKIIRISEQILNDSATFGPNVDPIFGAQQSAAALSSLNILGSPGLVDHPVHLLDLYFDSKARLLQKLLNRLSTSVPQKQEGSRSKDTEANEAEDILSKIVLILQYDVILHPYQIFVLRRFMADPKSPKESDHSLIMESLPVFPPSVVQSKASVFLSAHLPLIRTKVKTVLVDIAGTTASALGKIRQSLYDKTDGVESMERLDSNGVCTWEEAVAGVVNVQSVLSSSLGAGGGPMGFVESTVDSVAADRRFSLWGVLFSNTFSSLVHSLLTTSFHSVHTKVVSTLRLSLANAPPLGTMLPHEAYRNTLYIASELDNALLKVGDDAHELLVHAEERVESEKRLRQSLYVQTCEILGRLICELRRMLKTPDSSTGAVKELIVGRLCHLLKFRLTALPRLLDPSSSPTILYGTGGMISLLELKSAFDLADDNDDGLITFAEAMEAVDSAFSGTQFHGAEMVRETLLLPTAGEAEPSTQTTSSPSVSPHDVTLNELTLLLARGVRHETCGQQSALGTMQDSLDQIASTCFSMWSAEAIGPFTSTLSDRMVESAHTCESCSEEEFQRLCQQQKAGMEQLAHPGLRMGSTPSPHIVHFMLELSFALNRSVCPSDSLVPVPSPDYAKSIGIKDSTAVPCLMDMMRYALLSQGLDSVVAIFKNHVDPSSSFAEGTGGQAPLVQLQTDLEFVKACFFQRNRHGFGGFGSPEAAAGLIDKMLDGVDSFLPNDNSMTSVREHGSSQIFEGCDLFLSSLLGQDESSSVPLGIPSEIGGLGPFSTGMGSKIPFSSPLPSSCRYTLLPIQTDRTLSGVHARGTYKDKNETETHNETVGGGAMRAGLGFFSSMLKKT